MCYGEVRVSWTHSILSIFEYAERWWVVWIFWGGLVGGCGIIARSGDFEAVGLQYRGMYTCCKIRSKSRESKVSQIQSPSFIATKLLPAIAEFEEIKFDTQLCISCCWSEMHSSLFFLFITRNTPSVLLTQVNHWWWCRRSVCDVLRMCAYVSLKHPSSSSWPERASIREFQFKLLRLF